MSQIPRGHGTGKICLFCDSPQVIHKQATDDHAGFYHCDACGGEWWDEFSDAWATEAAERNGYNFYSDDDPNAPDGWFGDDDDDQWPYGNPYNDPHGSQPPQVLPW